MSSTAKAKTAKLSTVEISFLLHFLTLYLFLIVRNLLDFFEPIPNSNTVLMDVLHENIEWARSEKRIFLKHSLETRLVGM